MATTSKEKTTTKVTTPSKAKKTVAVKSPKGAKQSNLESYYGTGKRKSSIARVFLRPGKGSVIINQKEFATYFPLATARSAILEPLQLTALADKFDLYVTVKGGGISGQAGAVRLGVARALIRYDQKNNPLVEKDVSAEDLEEAITDDSAEKVLTITQKLRKAKMLTRDSRIVERKKCGFRKARKKEQFSKR